MCALTLLRVNGQLVDVESLHRQAQLALDEGLNQQGQEVRCCPRNSENEDTSEYLVGHAKFISGAYAAGVGRDAASLMTAQP